MIRILEDAVLGSRLDCQNFDLLNIRYVIPVPDGLLSLEDPALYDPRVPPIASITNEHVATTAGIGQGKFSLDGEIPLDWLGTDSTQAAQGDLAEMVANKGAHSGYVPLDDTLKIPATHVNAGINPGTVNSVSMIMPPEIPVTGSPILSDAGSFDATWQNAPSGSYLGVNGPSGVTSDYLPAFITGPLPVEIIPDLDGSQFTTGTFSTANLPTVTTDTSGMLPDPGQDGDPDHYFGRDKEWHEFAPLIAYQPTCKKPIATLDSWSEDEVLVTVRSSLKGSSLFIRINNGPWQLSKIQHHASDDDVCDTITVHDGDRIWAYTAKAGYNNSDNKSVIWTVKTPLSD